MITWMLVAAGINLVFLVAGLVAGMHKAEKKYGKEIYR